MAKRALKSELPAADVLLKKARAYFDWCDQTPWIKREPLKSGAMAGTIIDVPVQRPYTLVGLCVYLSISEDRFREYEQQPSLSEACIQLRQAIRQNQLEGLTVGAYSASVIARLLNLDEDAANTEVTGEQPAGNSKFEVEIIRAE